MDGNGQLVTQPYIIKTVGGLRVAVIGAVMGNLVGTYTTAAEIGPWRVLPLFFALPPKLAQGRALDPDKEYKVAVTDFTAANQASQPGTSDPVFAKTGPWQRDLVIEWIRKKKVLE